MTIAALGAFVAAALTAVALWLVPPGPSSGSPDRLPTEAPDRLPANSPGKAAPTPSWPTPSRLTLPRPTPAEIAALPEVRYDAVIPGLLAFTGDEVPSRAYSLRADTPIYGADRRRPVARFGARNFLGEPTVVVPVGAGRDGWVRVLTPARQSLPSESGGDAPAQTAGWVRTEALIDPVPLPRRIVISSSEQSLTIRRGDGIEDSFRVGVGAPGTPTPVKVTGYLQARYLDPAQNQSRYAVQLSSLHSAAADEPYGGSDGGLIGLHYERTATGAVSHGCIRLPAEAVAAVDRLPLGTPVVVTG